MSRIIFPIVFAIIILPFASYGQSPNTQTSRAVEITLDSWYYRWGESPLDAQGRPIWILDNASSAGWKPVGKDPEQEKHNILWLMIPIPEGRWGHPALLLPPVYQNLEVYQNYHSVYRFGEFRPSGSNKYCSHKWHEISLESDSQSNLLFLKIYADKPGRTGIQYGKVWVGPQSDIIKAMIRLGTENAVLGFLLTFVGFFAIFIYIRRIKQNPYILLSFAAFVICVGVNHIMYSPITQLFIKSAGLRHYMGMTAFVLFPVGMYIFTEHVHGQGYKSLIRRIWQIHILAAVTMILLNVTDVYPMPYSFGFLFILLFAGIAIMIPIAFKTTIADKFEAKMFNMGMLAMMGGGVHDMLTSFGVIPPWHFLFAWGVFVYVIFLVFILEHRFNRAHDRLQAYSRELEISHQKLEEYNVTLEQKVEDRTQELSGKNAALEQAYQKLRETQTELVMQSKMASLGDLVAGVAHEMNNPIGVIHSAADTAGRGMASIRNSLQNGQEAEQLQGSFSLVERNHQIITSASERITETVRSLRTFATLDEALFQQVNIHDNIDTTLSLLYHELRDKVTVIKEYGDIPLIQCYPNELNQAFMNLLVNAIQAIEEKGTITVATYADDTKVYVRISDTGRGIPTEDLPKIYDPGFTTKGAGVGKGLGLSIVYNIIQKHRGEIQTNSEVGKGTEVVISLPLEQTSR